VTSIQRLEESVDSLIQQRLLALSKGTEWPLQSLHQGESLALTLA
jgi:hypothetical protein